MPEPRASRDAAARAIVLAGLAVAGLATLLGSGGGFPAFGDCPTLACTPGDPLPPIPRLAVSPEATVVAVGDRVTFSAAVVDSTLAPAVYRWRRSADDGRTWSVVPGATGPVLVLPAASLADDATLWQVDAQPTIAGTAIARLLVSATPPRVFEDGDFPPPAWADEAWAPSGRAAARQRTDTVADGGRPGAWRRTVTTIASDSGVGTTVHLRLDAVHDPRIDGAVRALQLRLDCRLDGDTGGLVGTDTGLLLEQAGRRYATASSLGTCGVNGWATVGAGTVITPADLVQIDGPACGAGESCPDLGPQGAPLRLGHRRGILARPGESWVHGTDNWRVAVWRR